MHGYEKLQILGDEFCFKTVDQYFHNHCNEDNTHNTFTCNNYEVREFVTSKYKSSVRNVLNRIIILAVKSLNEQSIVMVLDDNILYGAKVDKNADFYIFYTKLMSYLFCKIRYSSC